jgi:hypothetical protein
VAKPIKALIPKFRHNSYIFFKKERRRKRQSSAGVTTYSKVNSLPYCKISLVIVDALSNVNLLS